MTIGGEKETVQNPLIKYAVDAGWTYLASDDALLLRGSEADIVLKDTFICQILKLNPFMTLQLAEDLIKRLQSIPPNIEGNLLALQYLKGLRQIFVPNEKRERDVRFIDTESIDNNTFHVTDEFSFTNGKKTIRGDVVFVVNGLPVIIVETKAAHKIEGIAEALDQIRRYHEKAPELMAMLQIYSLTHLIKYYYGATWNTSRKGCLIGKRNNRVITRPL